jgi:uncharacterized Zn finger protein
MTRESAEVKARRYLGECRLTVISVAGDSVTAVCRGSGDVYNLGHRPRAGWYCSCPAKTGRCAHLLALMSVTVRQPPAERTA